MLSAAALIELPTLALVLLWLAGAAQAVFVATEWHRIRTRYLAGGYSRGWPRVVGALFLVLFVVATWLVPAAASLVAPSAAALVTLGYVDAACHKLPNRLVAAAGAGAALSLVLMSFVSASQAAMSLAISVGAAALFLVLMGLGIGAGDVKLSPVGFGLAALSGAVLPYLVSLALLPGVEVLVRKLTGRASRHIAYGPWLVLCLPVALCWEALCCVG